MKNPEQFRQTVKDKLLGLMMSLRDEHPNKGVRSRAWLEQFVLGITGLVPAVYSTALNEDWDKALFDKLWRTIESHVDSCKYLSNLKSDKVDVPNLTETV